MVQVAVGEGLFTPRWSRPALLLEIATMKTSFVIGADLREMQGKGASRRLRHKGKVPAILYGGKKEPRALTLDQQNLLTMIDNEKFYSSIINIKLDGKDQQAIELDVEIGRAHV